MSRQMSSLLEINPIENDWTPPEINAYEYAEEKKNDVNALQSDNYLYIFRTEPYIDSIYVEYDSDRNTKSVRRLTIREGYRWNNETERFFNDHCVKEELCTYNGGAIDRIYKAYSSEHPEWHLQRYYTKGLRVLDHINNCLNRNTAKEILYKAGLDDLAAHIHEIDRLNLLAGSPSDLYDGISIRILRNLNCPYGPLMLSDKSSRDYVKKLNSVFPKVFSEKLNDAQCRYLHTLMKGDLTIGETGRLFEARRADLAKMWTMSVFDFYMYRENRDRQIREQCHIFGAIDPIYERYIKKMTTPEHKHNLHQLEYYLLVKREEYDRAIRRANRRRDYTWMERGDEYYVRYPQTINDFCREAIYMQNCLLTYVEAMIKNDTTILFMRKADDVNKPFITIEIYDGELMQAYHRFNKDCTKGEAEWIRGYCERHGIKARRYMFDAAVDELF